MNRKISVKLAEQLIQLLEGAALPYGQLKSELVDEMVAEGILQIKLKGRSRRQVYASKSSVLTNYLNSQWGISDLRFYASNLKDGDTRGANIAASTNSKVAGRRTFKGFLVNCITPVQATLKGRSITIKPIEGLYTYIHDFEEFKVPDNVVIIGVENGENFRYLHLQKHLFGDDCVLFVSRYPQSNDLVSWLGSVNNKYIHYGDFDFEGIRIFRDEFYKQLGEKACFFIPPNIEEHLSKYGNKKLYDKQYQGDTTKLALNNDLKQLLSLFHKYKRCLEQELLIVHK